MGSSVGKLLMAAAPAIAGSVLLGPVGAGLVSAGVGGAIGGGIGGLATGGGVIGGLTGAASGYGIGSLGSSLAGAAQGSGLFGAGAQTAAGDTAFNSFLNGTGTAAASNAVAGGGLTGGLAAGFPSVYNLGSTLSNAGASLFSPSSAISGAGNILTEGGSPSGNAIDASTLGGGTFGNGSFAPSTALTAANNAGGPSSTLASFFGSGNTNGVSGGGAGGGGSSFGGLGLGSILSGASNLASGVMNSNAIDKATAQLQQAQNTNIANNAPFLASGTAADAKLGTLLGTSANTAAPGYGSLTTPFTGADLTSTPGYQFTLDQGNQALNRQLASSGMLDSGAALKAAQQFGQGLAGTTFNNAFNQDLQTKQNTYNQLAGQTNVGVAAANNGQAPNTMLGNAGASGTIAGNNNLTSTIANIVGKTVIGYDASGKPIYSS